MTEPTYTAFRDAIADGSVDRVLSLIRAGVNFTVRTDVDLAHDGPALLKLAVEAELAEAARTGEEAHVDLTALLMIGGANPRRPVDGQSALDLAIARGHWLAGLVMDQWGRHPQAAPGPTTPLPDDELIDELLQSIEHERFRQLRDLLTDGVDVHSEVDGRNLLMLALSREDGASAAVGKNHLDCSAILLAMGADPLRSLHGEPRSTAAERARERLYAPDILLYESWTRLWEFRG